MAKVLYLFRAPKRRAAMEELPTARVIENAGFEGCAHARPGGKRQVLLVDIETLRALQLAPGIIRENITTEGFEVNELAIGEGLEVGEVELEVSSVCAPGELMEHNPGGIDGGTDGTAGDDVPGVARRSGGAG